MSGETVDINQNITVTTNLYGSAAHAEQLGHLCVAWANLEWHMYLIFDRMSGSPPALARSAFYAIESNRGRREMMLAVSRRALERATDRSVLEDILRRVGKTASQRNKYVHDTWGIADTQKREVFQLRLGNDQTDRDMDEVTVPDLKATTDHIQKLAEELNFFRNRIAPLMSASLEKLRLQPGIALRFSKKGLGPGRLPKGHHGQRKS
jgi:hypothetical protein